jgi:hypothetical protein
MYAERSNQSRCKAVLDLVRFVLLKKAVQLFHGLVRQS